MTFLCIVLGCDLLLLNDYDILTVVMRVDCVSVKLHKCHKRLVAFRASNGGLHRQTVDLRSFGRGTVAVVWPVVQIRII